MNKLIFWIGIFSVLIVSYWAIKPLTESGYFPMHDDTQVARVVVMGNALKEGQFPVRLVSDLGYGYGYPIFNFYGPLPYYVGGAFYVSGYDPVVSTKIMFAIGVILSAIFCYALLFPIAGLAGSIVGSVLFVYAPYHAVQVYIRGAVGEYWAIAFVPLILLGVYKLLIKKESLGIVIGGMGLFGVIASHSITGLLVMVFISTGILVLFLYQLITQRIHWRMLLFLCVMCILGLGLSSFFWIPAFFEMSYTGVSQMVTTAPTVFSDHFLCAYQLWNSPWGFGGSASGCLNDGMSFKIGKLYTLIVSFMTFLLLFYALKKQIKSFPPLFIVAIGMGIASVIGTLEISKPLWNIFPYTAFIQYPWRLLSFSMLSIGMFCGIGVGLIKAPVVRRGLAIIVVILAIGINGKLFMPQYVSSDNLSHLASTESIKYRISKISDEYLPMDFIKPMSIREVPSSLIKEVSGISVVEQKNGTANFLVAIYNTVLQSVIVQKAYFPGWIYKVNGLVMSPVVVHGLPVFSLPAGRYTIEGEFINTRVRSVGNIISILFMLLLGGVIYYGHKTNA